MAKQLLSFLFTNLEKSIHQAKAQLDISKRHCPQESTLHLKTILYYPCDWPLQFTIQPFQLANAHTVKILILLFKGKLFAVLCSLFLSSGWKELSVEMRENKNSVLPKRSEKSFGFPLPTQIFSICREHKLEYL